MNELLSVESDVNWEHIAPHLDAATFLQDTQRSSDVAFDNLTQAGQYQSND